MDQNSRVIWYKDGKDLSKNSRYRTLYKDGSCKLVFSDCQPKDAGTYRCEAINRYGKTVTESRLYVLGPELDPTNDYVKFLAEDVLRNARSTDFTFEKKPLNDQDSQLLLTLIQLNCPKVNSISLQDNGVTFSENTMEILHHFQSLKSLVLCGNTFTNEGAKALNASLATSPYLQELNLSKCHLNTTELISGVLENIESCTNMNALDLSHNDATIDGDAVRHLAGSVAMKELDLRGNKFTAQGIRQLADVVDFMSELKLLKLDDCHVIDSEPGNGLLETLKNKFDHNNK